MREPESSSRRLSDITHERHLRSRVSLGQTSVPISTPSSEISNEKWLLSTDIWHSHASSILQQHSRPRLSQFNVHDHLPPPLTCEITWREITAETLRLSQWSKCYRQ